MSFSEIEAELETLTMEQLRCLALKSWTAFVARESQAEASNECSEDDPLLLAALDEAIDKTKGRQVEHSGTEVRARLKEWTSR